MRVVCRTALGVAELVDTGDPRRLIVIMGSGETSPTMVGVHRDVVTRLGPALDAAVLVETPYGFQENADDISARAQTYFARSVGLRVEVPPGLRGSNAPESDVDRGLAALRAADWVFAG